MKIHSLFHRVLQAGRPAFAVVLSASALIPTGLAMGQTPAPPTVKADRDAEIAALKADIEILKGKVPDQSHAMRDVAYHFTNLWFAGQQQNWPLAKFYCDETRAHLKWAVRIIPVRKVNGADFDLRTMLDGLDQSLFAALGKTIDAKNGDDFSKAYKEALTGCYSCHVASGKPFLHLKVPDQPEARIIDFAPSNP